MGQGRSSRQILASLAAGLLAILVPIGSVGAQDDPSPSPTPVTAAAAMPPLAPGAASVPFSVAPVDVAEPGLTLLTRWRSCGHDAAEPEAAVAHVTESTTDVAIRIDVESSPTGELCEAGTLIRLLASLEGPVGGRAIRDAGRPARDIVNLVDPIDTGLRYSCGHYRSQESYSVAELLGPGLELEAGILPAMAPDRRVVRRRGDEIRVLGPLQPKGWVHEDVWRLRGDGWVRALELVDRRCILRAQLMENIATATWRLRGRRPTARSRQIAIWVHETVCNGRQLYGRVAQPIVQVRPDAVIITTGSMRDLVTPLGERVEDPDEYFGPYPGSEQARGGGYTFVDCPGIGPAPYVITLHRRLGRRALLDGGMFPPREVRPARAGREASAPID
ncbi:hypothetical protein BH23CHL8_BH23CHL8_03300 [soil metagenome]